MDGDGMLEPRMNEEALEPRFQVGGFQRVSHYTLWSWGQDMEVQKIGFARKAIKADGVGAGIAPIGFLSLKSLLVFLHGSPVTYFLYVKLIYCHDAIPNYFKDLLVNLIYES
ncbi:hypothetical protein EDC14_100942 [Hydrogenispora ethanolica]|uniref:Uncharacterized protein n=1 Tax=Hydrogenispora ethanolica TaxID=1082276 RepID=A0A4R1RVP0_HYDET|nr:hypothetical protein [Hydrogenispora ethanolica]TCL70725.1 hypothetical protein EDC14_100942 [Hydrogenispora ethanolica]